MKLKTLFTIYFLICAVAFIINAICIFHILSIQEYEIDIDLQVYTIEEMEKWLQNEEVLNIEETDVENVNRCDELRFDIEKISHIKSTNKQEWFIKYKSIIDKYKDISTPVSVYDVFSNDEINLILKTIETECYQAGFDAKVNVASVIINRIESREYGDTVEEVIKSPNQFTYFREKITDETILSLEYAYMIEDTTNGCVAFRSGLSEQIPHKWGKWELQFIDEVGHGFYL